MLVFRTFVFVTLSVAVMLHNLALATEHTVGDRGGWDTTSNLQVWASSNIFLAGDGLSFTRIGLFNLLTSPPTQLSGRKERYFDYKPNHNVLEVSKQDFDACRNSKPIHKYSGGKTSIHLGSAGTRYFICGTSGHCSQGMKVEINTFAPAFPPTDPESWPPMVGPSFPPGFSAPQDVPTWVPAISPSNPPTGDPTNSFQPAFLPPPPYLASLATKVNLPVWLATGFSFVITMSPFL
ncbi:uclacyanin 1 [Daucus carota subsp. sativus]|uniref:uclacyanin 1 n=1 Tax=Daucus carota subsp. sativus TaxID=79200 RepID=UPI003083C4C7